MMNGRKISEPVIAAFSFRATYMPHDNPSGHIVSIDISKGRSNQPHRRSLREPARRDPHHQIFHMCQESCDKALKRPTNIAVLHCLHIDLPPCYIRLSSTTSSHRSRVRASAVKSILLPQQPFSRERIGQKPCVSSRRITTSMDR